MPNDGGYIAIYSGPSSAPPSSGPLLPDTSAVDYSSLFVSVGILLLVVAAAPVSWALKIRRLDRLERFEHQGAELERITEERNGLRREKQRITEERNGLRQEKQRITEERDDLRHEGQQATDERNVARREAIQLQAELRNAQTTAESTAEDFATLRMARNQLEEACNRLRDELARQGALENTELALKQEELVRKQEELRSVEAALRRKEHELTELERRFDRLKMMLHERGTEMRESRMALEESDRLRREREAEVGRLEEKVGRYAEDLRAAEARLGDRAREAMELQALYDDARTRLRQLEESPRA